MHSDAGTNLVRAAKDMEANKEEEETKFDFRKVAKMTGVAWFFAPPGAQFRNGCMEAYVKKLKFTMII